MQGSIAHDFSCTNHVGKFVAMSNVDASIADSNADHVVVAPLFEDGFSSRLGNFQFQNVIEEVNYRVMVLKAYVIPLSNWTPTFVIKLFLIAHVGRLVGLGICQSLCLNNSHVMLSA